MPRRAVMVEKSEGETPLVALERFRAGAGLLGVPMTYAGRLDPMASGKLLILIGDECKRRNAYDRLDKEYDFEILFGISSDTGDILGLADACAHPAEIPRDALEKVLAGMRGTLSLPYPAYSSKPVGGKPLFVHAREGTLGEITVPQARMRIRSIWLTGMRTIASDVLRREIEDRLSLLRIEENSTNEYKDFRRDAVRARWREVLAPGQTYTIARARAIVGSGTYIRALAPRIADDLGACGLAYSIHRTRIGRYVGIGQWGIWARSYRAI